MTLIVSQPLARFTPDDLLNLKDERLHELVDGRLVEKQMSSLASRTAGINGGRLFVFLEQSPLGNIYPEQSFQCFPHDAALIRRPDIAFIAANRAAGVPEEGHVPIAPDLAIEIISPTNTFFEVDEKLVDYREARVKLVWVVNPKQRLMRVHRPDRTVIELGETDMLSGEGVLPGFSILVKDLLPALPATLGTPK